MGTTIYYQPIYYTIREVSHVGGYTVRLPVAKPCDVERSENKMPKQKNVSWCVMRANQQPYHNNPDSQDTSFFHNLFRATIVSIHQGLEGPNESGTAWLINIITRILIIFN